MLQPSCKKDIVSGVFQVDPLLQTLYEQDLCLECCRPIALIHKLCKQEAVSRLLRVCHTVAQTMWPRSCVLRASGRSHCYRDDVNKELCLECLGPIELFYKSGKQDSVSKVCNVDLIVTQAM